ncbi:MAG: hypothetical protein K8S18_04995 [Desulfobacula sp.]|nr:hypothetical protein [Desulfobacula sp.]
MKADTITLEVGGHRIENFTKYRIESDLFVADDAFDMTFENPGIDIEEGQRCKLYINSVLELNGIIDKVHDGYKKSGPFLCVSGRDLMGLLVDSHIGTGKTDEKIELKALARDLLCDVPFINRKNIIYGKGNKIKAVAEDDFFEIEKAQREPGKSIFDVLKKHAMERGLLFFCMPDGTFVFGNPKSSGRAEFFIVNRLNGKGNNVNESDRVRDISKKYSSVTVIGQQQGEDWLEPEEINTTGKAGDTSFPFHKPSVASLSEDCKDPDKYAALLMNQQRLAGLQLTYNLDDHSQNGKNFQTNAICHVKDEFYGYDQKFLIYGRVFEMDENNGQVASLKLSELGVRPS